jgi:hypothetical protein
MKRQHPQRTEKTSPLFSVGDILLDRFRTYKIIKVGQRKSRVKDISPWGSSRYVQMNNRTLNNLVKKNGLERILHSVK